MNRWDEKFKQHPIHATLKEAADLINATKIENTNSKYQIEKRRILKVISAYQDVLSQIDPELVPYNILNDLNHDIQNPTISTYLMNDSLHYGEYHHLVDANDILTVGLGHLSQLLAFAKKSTAEKPIRGLEKYLDEFAAAIDAKKMTLEKDITDIAIIVETKKNELETLSDNINANEQRTDELITTWQLQHSNAQNDRQTKFTEDQEARKDNYDQWREKIKAETDGSIDSLIDKSSKKLETSQIDFDEKISTYIATAKDKHAAILKLYELVASDSVAGGYKKNADDEKKQPIFGAMSRLHSLY